MNLHTLYLTNNACYKAGHILKPKGIMVHSTGANNPRLSRYIAPDDGLLGENIGGNHWNVRFPGGISVCVHAFIGKLADGSIATYQTLPWDYRGWHAGGKANDSYIGFEICEDGLTDPAYFSAVYKEAVELCVHLCKQFGLTEKDIICHSEGHKLGIASNHADVMHWFPKHGKSMDTFRAAVKAALSEEEEDMTQDTFNKLMSAWQEQNDPLYKTLDDVPSYWNDDAAALVKAGAIKGDGVDSFCIRQSVLKAAIINKRYVDSIK
ncbi:MAG: N-acetylmuramoyl-L-alanine amidase [Clostridia bacterium]|nr:N-acetylmuramoyl-L-alanine amidase [Clostridia bacterium]